MNKEENKIKYEVGYKSYRDNWQKLIMTALQET